MLTTSEKCLSPSSIKKISASKKARQLFKKRINRYQIIFKKVKSGNCSLNRLEMTTKRVKTFILKFLGKLRMKNQNEIRDDFKDILASRKASDFISKAINLLQKLFKMRAIWFLWLKLFRNGKQNNENISL